MRSDVFTGERQALHRVQIVGADAVDKGELPGWVREAGGVGVSGKVAATVTTAAAPATRMWRIFISRP